jgi:hypothetical protein
MPSVRAEKSFLTATSLSSALLSALVEFARDSRCGSAYFSSQMGGAAERVSLGLQRARGCLRCDGSTGLANKVGVSGPSASALGVYVAVGAASYVGSDIRSGQGSFYGSRQYSKELDRCLEELISA